MFDVTIAGDDLDLWFAIHLFLSRVIKDAHCNPALRQRLICGGHLPDPPPFNQEVGHKQYIGEIKFSLFKSGDEFKFLHQRADLTASEFPRP